MRLFLALACVLLAMSGAPTRGEPEPASPQPVAAAVAFLTNLPAEARRTVQQVYASPTRTRWSGLPGRRAGLMRGILTTEDEARFRVLLNTLLSPQGVARVDDIRRLEEVLYAGLDERTRRRRPEWRDPGAYRIAIFGTPAAERVWGFRLEGHHLSLNLTLRGNTLTSAEPSFFGASPARVGRGRLHLGLEPFATESRLSRQFLLSLPEHQKRLALLGTRSPGMVEPSGGRSAPMARRGGLASSQLGAAHREALDRHLAHWFAHFPAEYGERRLAEIRASSVRFQWFGGTEEDAPRRFEIVGPHLHLAFSYERNHIHAVLRDPRGDFGHRPR